MRYVLPTMQAPSTGGYSLGKSFVQCIRRLNEENGVADLVSNLIYTSLDLVFCRPEYFGLEIYIPVYTAEQLP